MIKFYCDTCHKKIGVPPHYAGKRVKCPKCAAVLTVPEPDLVAKEMPSMGIQWSDDLLQTNQNAAPADEGVAAAQNSPVQNGTRFFCPKCKAANYQDSEFCVNCGAAIELPVKKSSDRAGSKMLALSEAAQLPITIAGGLAGAFLGAVIWAGIVYATGYEIGWAAWGIGVLSALGLRVASRDSSRDFGALAVVCAILGMVAGKFLTIQWVAVSQVTEMLSDMSDQDEMVNYALQDQDALFNHVCMHLCEEGRFDRETAELAQLYNLKEEIPEEKVPEVQKVCEETHAYMDTLSPADKKEIVKNQMSKRFEELGDSVQEAFDEISYKDKLRFAMSDWYFDVLWFFIAIGSAYKIGAGW